jgi:hypothetical protein
VRKKAKFEGRWSWWGGNPVCIRLLLHP